MFHWDSVNAFQKKEEEDAQTVTVMWLNQNLPLLAFT